MQERKSWGGGGEGVEVGDIPGWGRTKSKEPKGRIMRIYNADHVLCFR